MNAARWAVGMPWRGQDVAYDDATAGQAWRTVWTVGDHDQVAPERAPVIAHRPVAGDVGGSAGADDQSSVLQRRRRPQVAAVLRLQSDAAVVRVGQQRVQIRVQRARCREVVKRGQVSVPPLFGGRQHGMRCGRASAKQVRLIHSKRAGQAELPDLWVDHHIEHLPRDTAEHGSKTTPIWLDTLL